MYPYLHIGRASEITDKRDRAIYRFFEIFPGLIAWLTIIAIFVLSFLTPAFIAIFIILFDVYWLTKTVYLSLHLRISYNRLKTNLELNWLEHLQKLSTQEYKISTVKSWQDIYHLVFLPLYAENYSLVSATMEGLLRANYPKEKFIVVLCWEERGGESTKITAQEIEQNYGSKFFRFISVMHPASGLEGEIAGKGSNTAYAAKKIKEELIDRLGINYDRILVSNLDIDTVIYPEYFAILSFTFLTSENPLRASYQPVPLYVNNIWEAPSFARVVAFSATFWHTIKQEKNETATTFSSHSMPFRALVDIGYWQRNMVSEDSRVFWQCFLRYDGDYMVVPLYYPVSMDANVAHTSWQTFKNVYKQQRRWGYGVENVPYFLLGFIKNKKISLSKKLRYGFTVVEGFHSWATNALIIFLLGWLPVIVGGSEFNRTVLSLNLPYITRTIMTLSMVGLISTAVLSIILLPPRPPKFGKFKYLWMILQWILFPVTTIGLGLFPGLEAQTRLMLGKYMGFWVTPKYRN
jgi:hypothetical protein